METKIKIKEIERSGWVEQERAKKIMIIFDVIFCSIIAQSINFIHYFSNYIMREINLALYKFQIDCLYICFGHIAFFIIVLLNIVQYKITFQVLIFSSFLHPFILLYLNASISFSLMVWPYLSLHEQSHLHIFLHL
jgi:hypothetical protein